MKDSLETRCGNFIAAQKIIANAEPLQSRFIYPVCAELFLEHGVVPDPDKLKECDHLIIKEAGIFSDFGGLGALIIISHLSMSPNPKKHFDELEAARKVLREEFPPLSDYLPIAAVILSETEDRKEWKKIARKAKKLYDELRKKHILLSSGGDMVYAVILARSVEDTDEIVKKAEECYNILKQKKYDALSTLSLSRVLALKPGTAEENCKRVTALYNALNLKGAKYGKEYQLPVLGLAAMLPDSTEEIASEILKADKILSKQKQYKGIIPTYSSSVRLMHAAMIVSGNESVKSEIKADMTAAVHQNMFIAMQIALWSLLATLFI